MGELPIDLQSDPMGASERLVVKPLNLMEQIHRTLDSIRYNRATGQPWGALVDHLYNLTGGLRDLQFWDGMPKDVREEVRSLEKSEDWKERRKAEELRSEYSKYGWNGVSVRARRSPDGTPRFVPTPQDLDQMLEILMQLLQRNHLLWKTRLYSPLPPVPGRGPGGENGVE